jgi:endonuclease YncB( thermonuclease family)
MKVMTGLLASLLSFGLVLRALAGETLPGPLPARVVQVLDGDTLEVAARIWLDQEITIKVRLDGIDTPEIRAKCAAERAAAARAKAFVSELVDAGPVALRQIRYGKYAGRVLARVAAADGRDLSRALIAERLARPYNGGRRRPWCSSG